MVYIITSEVSIIYHISQILVEDLYMNWYSYWVFSVRYLLPKEYIKWVMIGQRDGQKSGQDDSSGRNSSITQNVFCSTPTRCFEKKHIDMDYQSEYKFVPQ